MMGLGVNGLIGNWQVSAHEECRTKQSVLSAVRKILIGKNVVCIAE